RSHDKPPLVCHGESHPTRLGNPFRESLLRGLGITLLKRTLRNVEWARLEPLIPKALPTERPRKTDMRAAMNAILYLLRTGCPWRYLPSDSFPPRSTVYNIFRKFQRDGVWEAIWAELHMGLRERMGREASPSAAVLDSQSVKSAEKEKGAILTTSGLRRRQAGEGPQSPRPGRH